MKTLTRLLCCCICYLPSIGLSQDLVKDGFIVLQKGDTIYGEIRCRNWSWTPQSLLFRDKKTQELVEYFARDVQYFEAGGNRFVRCLVWVDERPVDYELGDNWILPEYSIRLERKIVFLKYLLVGTKYDLLELIEGTKSHYYLRDKAGIITPLEYKVFLNCHKNISISYLFREMLDALNRNESNDPAIRTAISETLYDSQSLTEVIERINKSKGDVLYKNGPEPRQKKLTFFAGVAGGISISIPERNFSLKTGTGPMAGIIGGFDLSMGYSYKGGESFFRFDILVAQTEYSAKTSEEPIGQSLQYSIIPSMQIRLPLFTFEHLKSHIGGGFKTPIHLSERNGLNQLKNPSSDDRFPWVAVTVGGQLDFQIRKRWEIGLAAYQAPSVDFGSNYMDPLHCYTSIAYRFK